MTMRVSLERLIFLRTPVSEFLEKASGLGVDGVEFAEFELSKLAKDSSYGYDHLLEDVRRHGLSISGIYWSADFHRPEARGEVLVQAARLASNYRRIECYNVVIGPPRRVDTRSEEEALKALDELSRTLRLVSKIFLDCGVRPSLHNHYDTMVETSDELEYVLSSVEPELLGFCPDTAHLALAGIPILETIGEHLDRITYVHLKDLRPSTGTEGRIKEWYKQTKELGEGIIDFSAVIRLLKSSGQVEWLVVEQDYSEKSPEESARASLDHLSSILKTT